MFFDDFKITHTKSPIISADDYYPFGLAIQQNSYQRESAVDQRYKYNSKELQPELGLNWHDYGARMYQADLGRFFNIDRFAEDYYDFTPYHYTLNNPIVFVDVNGDSTIVSDALETLRTAPTDIPQGFKQMGAFFVSDVLTPLGKSIGNVVSGAIDFFTPEEGKGGSQGGGITLTNKSGGASSTKQKSENPAPEVEGDLLLQVVGGAAAGKFSRGRTINDLSEGINRIPGIIDATNNTFGQEDGDNEEGATPKRDTVDISGGGSIHRDAKGGIKFGTRRAVVLPQNDTIIRRVSKEEILKNR